MILHGTLDFQLYIVTIVCVFHLTLTYVKMYEGIPVLKAVQSLSIAAAAIHRSGAHLALLVSDMVNEF